MNYQQRQGFKRINAGGITCIYASIREKEIDLFIVTIKEFENVSMTSMKHIICETSLCALNMWFLVRPRSKDWILR